MTDTHCARLGPESPQHLAEGWRKHLVSVQLCWGKDKEEEEEEEDGGGGWAVLFSGAGEQGDEKMGVSGVMFALLWQTQMGKGAAGGVVFILSLSASFTVLKIV